MSATPRLPGPAHYYPFTEGEYNVSVGLQKLARDFGNEATDQKIIQLDNQFFAYQQTRQSSRQENFSKYVQLDSRFFNIEKYVTFKLLEIVQSEYPEQFTTSDTTAGQITLECKLTGDTLLFSANGALLEATTNSLPAYQNALDALASQVQEDISVVSLDNKGGDYIAGLHLCFPNYWSAQQKIGQSFIDAHSPVPGFGRIARHASKILQTLTTQGPFVRFAWGITTDNKLNHHPTPPPRISPEQWHGRSFNPASPELYVRTERQVTVPLPECNSFIFLIRTYIEDVAELYKDSQKKESLVTAIGSMNEAELAYKGLKRDRDEMLNWLRRL